MKITKDCPHCNAYKVGTSVRHEENCVTWNLPPEWISEAGSTETNREADVTSTSVSTDEREKFA